MSKNEKFEDIYSSSDGAGAEDGKLGKIKIFFLKNRKRNLKALFSILICLVLVVSAMAGAYVRKMLSLINFDEGRIGNPDATFANDDLDLDEDLSYRTMYDIESTDSLKDLLKSWANNGGEKLSTKNVVNVLLIGEDNDDGSHRSDSMILASVNRKEKKITLCSFLRDSYTYMTINGGERYDKTNHAYSWGGAAKVMEVLSDNYKIKIDHYVSIDFESFVKVIDILGGVTVPITEKEANFMNRTTKIAGFTSGDAVKLNGKRALIYARIRKLDSEIERTRRQRNVIASVIQNVKASSISDINKAIETFLPYVTTNYRTSEIVSLGKQALSEGWLKYEIVGMFEPSDEFRAEARNFRTYTGYLDVWIVDYIKAAREVQIGLYGNTNISISSDHVSALDLVSGAEREYYNNSGQTTQYDLGTTDGDYDNGGTTSWFDNFTRQTNEDATSSTSFRDRLTLTIPTTSQQESSGASVSDFEETTAYEDDYYTEPEPEPEYEPSTEISEENNGFFGNQDY